MPEPVGTDAIVLELDRVTKQFGTVTAVDSVSERFARGEYCCILGPSGCGKTTLLRLIAGFEMPDSGSIRLHGSDVARVAPERRDVNVVFQQYALFPHMSVADNIGFGLRMKKLARAEIRERVRAMLALVRLEAEADRLPRQLSGGQQQRVALARALVNRPAVLLLDEPLSALDHALRRRMQEELRRVQRETGVTFVHITHDQGEALSLADRVAVMRSGRFIQIGSPRDIYLRPASRFVASFVGATNLLDATVDGADAVLDAQRARVQLPAGNALQGRVALAVRPESIRLVDARTAAADAPRGVVSQLSFAGADIECVIDLDANVHVRAHVPTSSADALREGDSVALAIHADDVVVLAAEPES